MVILILISKAVADIQPICSWIGGHLLLNESFTLSILISTTSSTSTTTTTSSSTSTTTSSSATTGSTSTIT